MTNTEKKLNLGYGEYHKEGCMKELHRVLKPEGKLHIKVLHFSRGFTHAEHAHGFDVLFPFYFNPAFTTRDIPAHTSSFGAWNSTGWLFHLLPSMGYGRVTTGLLQMLNAIPSWLANFSPAFCSRPWCFLVGGFEEIELTFV